MTNVTRNFTREELACPCCGLYNAMPEFLDMLQQARDLYNSPIMVGSCCRCIRHNKEVGGRSNSSHLRGLAVDVVALTSTTRAKLEAAFFTTGFKRKGIANRFIHFDVDKSLVYPCTWLY